MKIYTKKGDKGTTSLLGGTRVPKDDLRIDAYGTVDELNSFIGLLRDHVKEAEERGVLKEIQDRLFTMGSSLAADPAKEKIVKPDLEVQDIAVLEKEIDRMNEALPPMKSFILPGGHPTVSFCHIARCVCRRAERLVVALKHRAEVDPLVLQYLNRLSDYLFVLSRLLAKRFDAEEIPWRPRL